jgi:hypothetical protein
MSSTFQGDVTQLSQMHQGAWLLNSKGNVDLMGGLRPDEHTPSGFNSNTLMDTHGMMDTFQTPRADGVCALDELTRQSFCCFFPCWTGCLRNGTRCSWARLPHTSRCEVTPRITKVLLPSRRMTANTARPGTSRRAALLCRLRDCVREHAHNALFRRRRHDSRC